MNPLQNIREQKHLLLQQIGAEGQASITSATVVVIGAGGLGCSVLQSLTAAGLGNIRLVDGDQVEESNLARQILYGPSDVGRSKVQVVTERLSHINPQVQVETHPVYLDRDNANALLSGAAVILDCTDNYKVRYLIDEVAAQLETAVVHAALHQFQGQLTVFHHKNDLGFRSLYPDPEKLASIPTCEVAGVYAILPAILGLMQANEALKVILDIGQVANDRILLYDALKNELNSYSIPVKEREEHIQTRSYTS